MYVIGVQSADRVESRPTHESTCIFLIDVAKSCGLKKGQLLSMNRLMRARYLLQACEGELICYPQIVCFAGGHGVSIYSLMIRDFCVSENLVLSFLCNVRFKHK